MALSCPQRSARLAATGHRTPISSSLTPTCSSWRNLINSLQAGLLYNRRSKSPFSIESSISDIFVQRMARMTNTAPLKVSEIHNNITMMEGRLFKLCRINEMAVSNIGCAWASPSKYYFRSMSPKVNTSSPCLISYILYLILLRNSRLNLKLT